jgi:hypothetical protein
VGHEAPIGQPTEAVDGPFSFEAGFAGLEERGGRLGRLVAQYFERDQERKKIGRALVEERARNLEAARVRHELETRIQTIEGEASRARHEAESRVRTSDARLAEAKNELDVQSPERVANAPPRVVGTADACSEAPFGAAGTGSEARCSIAFEINSIWARSCSAEASSAAAFSAVENGAPLTSLTALRARDA